MTLNIFQLLFKKSKLLDVEKEVDNKQVEKSHRSLKPELTRLHTSVKILEKENKKMIVTLEEAMAIAMGAKRKGYKLNK